MAIIYVGNTEFEDVSEPVRSKSEFGADVLTRTVAGRLPLLQGFLDSLRQGQVFEGLYLQTWKSGDERCFPRVEMEYRGLLDPTALPDPDGQNDFTQKSVTKSATINNESVAEQIKGKPLASGETDEVSATMEMTFFAPTTRWRYLTNIKPAGPKFLQLNLPTAALVPRIFKVSVVAKWTTKEANFSSDMPAPLAAALHTPLILRADGHSANNIIGSPYWEATDTVTYEYEGD